MKTKWRAPRIPPVRTAFTTTISRALLAALLPVASVARSAQPEPVSVRIREPWGNVFADRETVFHAAVSSHAAFEGKIGWRFASRGATLARGEQAVSHTPTQPAVIDIHLRMPAVNQGVVATAALNVSAIDTDTGRTAGACAKTLRVFPETPFAHRQAWLKALNLRLFDPERTTSEVFLEAGIPFQAVRNVDTLSELRDAVLVVGEGVSFRDYRGLWAALVRTAASGVPVLCLAPAAGEIVVPGMGDAGNLPVPRRLAFRRRDVIRALDKRLDADAWPPDGKIIASRIRCAGERGPVVGRIEHKGEGWPWVEMEFDGAKEARLIVCGFAVIQKWTSGPSPRFLLAKLLEVPLTPTPAPEPPSWGEADPSPRMPAAVPSRRREGED